jgi:hypothetical protein
MAPIFGAWRKCIKRERPGSSHVARSKTPDDQRNGRESTRHVLAGHAPRRAQVATGLTNPSRH